MTPILEEAEDNETDVKEGKVARHIHFTSDKHKINIILC
jgi:hypothetical protein